MQREQPKSTTNPAEALEDSIIQTQLDYDGGEPAMSSSEGPSAPSAGIAGESASAAESDIVGSRYVLVCGAPDRYVVTPWFKDFPALDDLWKEIVRATHIASQLGLDTPVKGRRSRARSTSLVIARPAPDDKATVGMLVDVRFGDANTYWLRHGVVEVVAVNGDDTVEVVAFVSDECTVSITAGQARVIAEAVFVALAKHKVDVPDQYAIIKTLAGLEARHLDLWQIDLIAAVTIANHIDRALYFEALDPMLRPKFPPP